MKRYLRIAAICLLTGAVVNVAVAWVIAGASTDFDTARYQPREYAETQCFVQVLERFGCEQVGQGPFFHRSWMKTETVPRVIVEEAYGWPRLALRWYLVRPLARPVLHGGLELGEVRRSVRDGTGVMFPWMGNRTLPLIPIWSGFAANTLTYAALLWSLFAMRRIIRIRRGLCPECAYPIGESAVCVECGTALPVGVAR